MFLTLARLIRGYVFRQPRDRRAFERKFGWDDPRLAPHYARLRSRERWFHSLVNVATEWVRLDAQRAAKLLLDVVAWAAVLLLLLA